MYMRHSRLVFTLFGLFANFTVWQMADKRRGQIWEFFTVSGTNSAYAVCNTCVEQVKRGKTPKDYSTTPMINHLRLYHQEVYERYEAKKTETVQQVATRHLSLPSNQPTVADSFNMARKGTIDNSQALTIHKRIGEMIALDCQPVSIVTDVGFINLLRQLEPRYTLPSRKYFTQNVIPAIFTDTKQKMTELLREDVNVALTTDIWTSSSNLNAFISLTVHFIQSNFKRRTLVLNTRHFPEAHTGENISQKLDDMLGEWGIDKNRVNRCVSDNAANMKRAICVNLFFY